MVGVCEEDNLGGSSVVCISGGGGYLLKLSPLGELCY